MPRATVDVSFSERSQIRIIFTRTLYNQFSPIHFASVRCCLNLNVVEIIMQLFHVRSSLLRCWFNTFQYTLPSEFHLVCEYFQHFFLHSSENELKMRIFFIINVFTFGVTISHHRQQHRSSMKPCQYSYYKQYCDNDDIFRLIY